MSKRTRFCLTGCVVIALPLTFGRFAMGGIFTTELYAEHETFGYRKTVCGARSPAYCKCAVMR